LAAVEETELADFQRAFGSMGRRVSHDQVRHALLLASAGAIVNIGSVAASWA